MIPHADDISKNVRKRKESEINFEYEVSQEIPWHHKLLLNRPLKVILTVILATIVTPLLIYQLWYISTFDLPPADGYSTGSCLLPRATRLPCGVGHTTEAECHPQCCYDLTNNFCFHRLPSRFSYITDREWSENVILQPRISTVPYASQNSFAQLKLSIDEITATHLSLTFYNSLFIENTGNRIEEKNYTYEISSPELNIIVNASHGNIFNTIRGPLIASRDIWEIAFKLTNESMYGLGELPLSPGTVKMIYSHGGGVSSIPLIFAESNGSYHGLLIDSSAPTEVSILGENQIVVRSITSFGFKFHLFVGPHPKDIMRDVMKLIGYPNQFEYWMLGAHICSETSDTLAEAFTHLGNFIRNATTQNIPYESHCGVAPIVFNADGCHTDTIDLVNRGVQLLKSANKRFVPHISPYIIHDVFNDTSIDVGNETSRAVDSCTPILPNFRRFMFQDSRTFEIYKGSVGNNTTIYPSYELQPLDLMNSLWKYSSEVDAIVLENSWPLDESKKFHNETNLLLPYFNENFETAFNGTPQWNITFPMDGGKYLYKHNLYGNTFISTMQNFFDHKIAVWSSSQWLNGNVVINRQNISTSWTSLHQELIFGALAGISGHWLWSSPVCGDTEGYDVDSQIQLCIKWYMAAKFFPILKIHSKSVGRHPAKFVGTSRIYINDALNQRLSLLPYFYTALQEGPLLRPMFFQYPNVSSLKDVSTQFNVGEDLLIVPNLQPDQTHVHVWMPPGTWYELWSGLKLQGDVGDAVTMTTTAADFLTLIHGGSILILQKDVKETAERTRLLSPFSLIVALDCKTDNMTNCTATSHLFMTQNMTLKFETDSEELTIKAIGEDYSTFCNTSSAVWAHEIKEINIYGLEDELNNYDNHKHIQCSVDLCELEHNELITVAMI